MTILQLLLLSLFTYRVVRLWRFDTISEPLRARIIGSEDGQRNGWLLDHPNSLNLWLLDLLVCPWCLGVHVAFWGLLAGSVSGWVDIGWSWAGAVTFAVSWLAVAAVAAFWYLAEEIGSGLADRLNDDPDDDDDPYG